MEKIKIWTVNPKGEGSPLCMKEDADLLNNIKELLEEDDVVEVSRISMTEKEFEKLPEHGGW